MTVVSPTLPDQAAAPSLPEWYAEHRAIFGRIARTYTANAADAAELQQEMLYQLWTSLPRFTGQAKASTWVYRVCLNTALTWRRATKRRWRLIDGEADVGELAGEADSPAGNAERRNLLEELYAALRLLSPSERALVLPMLDGLTHREIGEITGLTENHVAVALLRIRRRLATLMKGLTDELG